jgi:hypothetical protein
MFPAPQVAISPPGYLTGFYASALVKDSGALQVGIGSLRAAMINSTPTAEEWAIAEALKRIQAETITGRGKLIVLVQAARTRDNQSRFQSLLERTQLADTPQ